MKALIGSRLKVTGSSTATVSAGPMPGSTPTAVPSVTPASAHARCGSVSALAKPAPAPGASRSPGRPAYPCASTPATASPRGRPRAATAAARARTAGRRRPRCRPQTRRRGSGCRESKARAVNQKSAADAITNPPRSTSSRYASDRRRASQRDRPPSRDRLAARAAGRRDGSRHTDHARRPGEDQQPGQHHQRIRAGGRERSRLGLAGPELPQDRAHARLLRVDEARERVARQVAIDPAVALERLAPRRRLHHGLDRRLETLPSRPDRVPAAPSRERQFSNSTSTPCSRSVGTSRPGRRSALEMASARTVPASICGANSARPLIPDRHLAAEDGRQRLAAAGEGDVVDARRRDADGVGDEAGENLVAAAGRSAAPRDRLGPLLERASADPAASGTATPPARRSLRTRRSAARAA